MSYLGSGIKQMVTPEMAAARWGEALRRAGDGKHQANWK